MPKSDDDHDDKTNGLTSQSYWITLPRHSDIGSASAGLARHLKQALEQERVEDSSETTPHALRPSPSAARKPPQGQGTTPRYG
jgi:hypothetical protein